MPTSLQSYGVSQEVESTNKYKLGQVDNFKSHTPHDNEWRKHATAGVNESFNVRLEINKRPDLPPVAKRASGQFRMKADCNCQYQQFS